MGSPRKGYGVELLLKTVLAVALMAVMLLLLERGMPI